MISFDKIYDKRKMVKVVITYCIHKGKFEATDGAQVDSKGARITQQWRIVNAIFSIQIKVQCLRGSFAFAWQKKNEETPRPGAKILTYKNSVEKPIKIVCTIDLKLH